jgi:hypothetical protein
MSRPALRSAAAARRMCNRYLNGLVVITPPNCEDYQETARRLVNQGCLAAAAGVESRLSRPF